MGQAGYGVVLVACASWVAAAQAQPSAASAQREPGVRLEWSVPEGSGCASREEIRSQVERLSEREPFIEPPQPAAYTIAGAIEPYETTWRARIALRDGSGREQGAREIVGRSPTCGTLNVPVALVIVTLADSLRPSAPAAAAAPAPRAPLLPRPHEPAPKARRVQLGFGAFGALDVGILPSAAVGVGAAVELRVPLPLAVDATLYAPVDEVDGEGRGARLVLWDAGLSVCPELAAAGNALRAQLCATGQLGAVAAAGLGLTRSTSAQRLVAIVGFEPKLVWFLSESVTARAGIVAGWVLARPTFRVDLEGQPARIFESDPITLQIRVGVMGFAL